MNAKALRELVWDAHRALAQSGLVTGTFGNVSGVDRAAGLMAIKPSGVPYRDLTPEHMVLVSLGTGEVIDASLRPSSDTATHLELYRAFPCGGIVHTHSEAATALAQARLPVRCMGTTHADYFRGDVPVTRPLGPEEVAGEYEKHTGLVIVDAFRVLRVSPMDVPAVLVANHGPVAWGADPLEAVEHARLLEWLARMDITVRLVAPQAEPPASWLVDRHYLRKHGPSASYGQTGGGRAR
jgi:L-ribulose-5-phosphate 4-epimerase